MRTCRSWRSSSRASSNAATVKGDTFRKVLAQLQRHHDVQMEMTRRDCERMKSTILQSRTRDEQLSVNTRSYVSRAQTAQNFCRTVEQDTALVNDEITELKEENRELEMELRRHTWESDIRIGFSFVRNR
jgi:hypothetical protein